MVAPPLTNDERAALENLATFGPDRALDPPLRGRLALYKLIDETPDGWKITALGREALAAGRPRHEPVPPEAREEEEEASARPTESERHYGRKTRNTSWLE
jgi:hypothetical protein